MTKLIPPSRSLAKAPKHSDMYVTSAFKVHVCMYGHIYTVIYLTHTKKRGACQVTAHTINKWELVPLRGTVVFLDYI